MINRFVNYLKSRLNLKPIEIGAGKVEIALAFGPDGVERNIVILDTGAQGKIGNKKVFARSQSCLDHGTLLANIRIVDADGAHVFVNLLLQAIANAKVVDDMVKEAKGDTA